MKNRPQPMFAIEMLTASDRRDGCRTTYSIPCQAAFRSAPLSARVEGSRSPSAIAAAAAENPAVTSSATGAPKNATSAPARAGPKTLATTYPLLSIAFARSHSGCGTRIGKRVRTPVAESGNVSDVTVTISRRSGTGSASSNASTAMSASDVAAIA